MIEGRTRELADAAWTELEEVLALGGAFEAIEEIKGRLVRSLSDRTRRIESGEQIVVGVNAFTETAPSPLAGEESILRVDPAVEAEMIADVAAWRRDRTPTMLRQRSRELRGRGVVGCERDARDDRLRQGRWHHGRVGRDVARRVRRVPRPDRRRRRRRPSQR